MPMLLQNHLLIRSGPICPCKPVTMAGAVAGAAVSNVPLKYISDSSSSRRSLHYLKRSSSPLYVSPSRLICNMSGINMIPELEYGNREGKKPEKRENAVFWIILLNLGIYVADHIFQVRGIKALYLYHNRPVWFQIVTATFCHANWKHLSSNLFFLYIFGKLVEEEEGSFALWISYLLTGAGANLVSWLILPRNSVSVGASGAVFGLFAVSVLVKMSWDWRKILEVLILGQFVIEKVMEAAQASIGVSSALNGGGSAMQNINHIAHLSGALIGAALVWLLSRVPFQPPSNDELASSKNTNKTQ
ncbi:rhomboid-like protein 11, chloroplastic [Impatiens glandulifera]|uniref:rhomboid-like protein 11, chloroplastic n=1 Tax=Impatiens glandulifera TaxID=253017 RepID=UPI001FB18E68|nr:rhomboid-like protein 11, chloroplastic [Impatiens glandulifera]